MICKKVIKTRDGRTFSSKTISSPVRVLVDIMNHLRGANGSNFHSLNGMFWRSYDFELSARAVKQQLLNAEILTEDYKEKGFDTVEFQKAAESKGLTLHARTNNSFSTISLGVALRHFINDTCRVLEPSARLLELKTGVQKSNPKLSLNSYIKELNDNNVSYGFDGAFFIALYEEVWNDYKHEESSGISAGGYSIDKGEIVYPIIIGGRLTNFKGKNAEDFVDEVLKNVQQFVDFVR